MPERGMESLRMMGWGLVVAGNSSAAAAAAVAVAVPGGTSRCWHQSLLAQSLLAQSLLAQSLLAPVIT